MIQAYCVKCRAKKEMKNPELIEMKAKGGKTRKALSGICAESGTKMRQFVSADYKLEE